MRALRILLIVVVVLGGLFVLADRLAVHFAEGEAADKLRTSENLASTPDVSIKGFPFLTQVAGGSLDDVEVGIKSYQADTGNGGEPIRIDDLKASMKGVRFTSGFGSATASTARGTASITYDQLLKAAKSQPTDLGFGLTARVVSLADGGNGKIKVGVSAAGLPTVFVLSSMSVEGDTVRVHADSLPSIGGVRIGENQVRSVTDFEQKIDDLPGGIRLDTVVPAKNGVEITVKGSGVRLAG
ncbi:DUF2993 domain-containing protein [Streptomyces longwoodensis]|uniref:DUF2993 domain-containing protein n=1 Tax=Streptomyces lasalocidi TaxID=324833 RepID=A0A4U5WHX0_STRLS|nr:DUF2993 domain-containing protein [Streptomyces lasalocidi]TKT01509.1 DUF2993 domain-containing protein [Streptomyces lasalocidi]